jgi:hypothetical protein
MLNVQIRSSARLNGRNTNPTFYVHVVLEMTSELFASKGRAFHEWCAYSGPDAEKASQITNDLTYGTVQYGTR